MARLATHLHLSEAIPSHSPKLLIGGAKLFAIETTLPEEPDGRQPQPEESRTATGIASPAEQWCRCHDSAINRTNELGTRPPVKPMSICRFYSTRPHLSCKPHQKMRRVTQWPPIKAARNGLMEPSLNRSTTFITPLPASVIPHKAAPSQAHRNKAPHEHSTPLTALICCFSWSGSMTRLCKS